MIILYIPQDGQWGGNVEVVVASRVYKRSIKVFSSDYANGVLSIEYDDEERTSNNRDDRSQDLMLSYHGNDHYNSVIDLNSKRHTSLALSTKGGKKSNNDNNPDNTNNANDGDVNNKDNDNTTQSSDGTESRSDGKQTRPPTRGSNCPCGSGKKYKKCCMSQEKAKKRAAKFAAENHLDAEEGRNSNHEKKDETDDDYIGNFRVITI